jgi:Co/Zn/Cd efflux system component
MGVMSDHHNHGHDACCAPPPPDSHYRAVLWAALIINALMFAVEVVAGVRAESVSLLADAVDFLGDAANYGVSLFVLPLALAWRARAALVKGLSMGSYGVGILALTAWNFSRGVVPDPVSMGVIGTLALVANVAVAVMLYRYRKGDANMRSVWLCTRNDAIGNIAVLFAALGVFGTKQGWPDLGVATVMAILALTAAISVVRQARLELRTQPA